jgi:TonB family protein
MKQNLSLLISILCLALAPSTFSADLKYGRLSLDVKETPFGAYDGAFLAAVQQRWDDILENTKFSKRSGKVVLEFQLTSAGNIQNMRVVTNGVGETLSLIAQKAVLDPAPYAPWPRERRQSLGKQLRDMRLTFDYSRAPYGFSAAVVVSGASDEPHASYGSFVSAAYENAWQVDPATVNEELSVQVRVTINRTGRIVSAKIAKPSGNATLDKSIRRALDSVTTLPPFPEGAPDVDRPFTVNFSLRANKLNVGEGKIGETPTGVASNLVVMVQQLTNAPIADRPEKFRGLVKGVKREYRVRAPDEANTMLRHAYVESFPMDAEIKSNILAQKIQIGMTSEQVRAAWDLFTQAIRVNETVSLQGKREQWVLPGDTYLFFDNDILTSWHGTKWK